MSTSSASTTGHLFERRHRAWLVEVDSYYVALLRYIHLNPVKAGIVSRPDYYPWSSHRAYLGEQVVPWLTTDFGLSLLGTSLSATRNAYRHLMQQPLYASEERLLADTNTDDARVLGSDRFLSSLPTKLFQPRSPLSLEELVQKVCHSSGISIDLFRSHSRSALLTAARVEIARRALEGRVASLSQVANFLGDEIRSSLSELLSRHNSLPPEPEHPNTGT